MRAIVFPRGRAYSAPSDRLGRRVAELVTRSGDPRERLCQHVYWTLEPGNPLGLLEEALRLAETVEPVEKRIRVEGVKTGRVTALDLPGQVTQALALGIVSEAEAATLRDYDRKVMSLVQVDDFAPNELGVRPLVRPEVHGAAQPQSDSRQAETARESDTRTTVRAG